MNIATFDFEAHLARQAAFSALTFGPGARTEGICDHIRKELVEVAAAPGDLKERIDVAILALDGAWRCGATPAQIIEALVAKQSKNEGRAWPDWRTADPAKAIEHDRSGESKQSDTNGKSQPIIGRLMDQISALPVLWGLNEPGALLRNSDVWRVLVAAGREQAAATATGKAQEPVDMLLYCPSCGTQHIDAAEGADWANPPHRSHLCHGCGHVWRPADVPTNGVAKIKTSGAKDSAPVQLVAVPDGWKLVLAEPNDAMQAAGAQAVRIDTTVINKIWTGNAVFRAMIAASPAAPAAHAAS